MPLGGRFSKHAQEQMELRGVSEEEVLTVLETTRPRAGRKPSTSEYVARVAGRRLTIVTNTVTGRVITVYVDA